MSDGTVSLIGLCIASRTEAFTCMRWRIRNANQITGRNGLNLETDERQQSIEDLLRSVAMLPEFQLIY
jgi:hypothetical protein